MYVFITQKIIHPSRFPPPPSTAPSVAADIDLPPAPGVEILSEVLLLCRSSLKEPWRNMSHTTSMKVITDTTYMKVLNLY